VRAAGEGLAVGLDVGGTKIAAGLVGADGSVLLRERLSTPDDTEALFELLVDAALRLSQGQVDIPVGVGAAGLVSHDGVIRYAPNISWVDEPLQQRLAERLGVAVTIDNDASAAAWGEFRVGAGSAVRSMAMLTLGTGVGGGLVIDERLVRGASGFGSEFGHIIVDEGGPACPCGNHGCLEPLASGTAIGRIARERLAGGQVPAGSALHRLDAVTGKAVTVAAHAGDAAAREVLATAGFWLGVGIASLCNAVDPELVVIGGGAIQAGELVLEPARRAFVERLIGAAQRRPTKIVRASLSDDAGLVGAALLSLDGPAPAGAA